MPPLSPTLRPEPENLDDQFGEPLEPSRLGSLESALEPRSLQSLNEDSAKLLKSLMKTAEEGLGVTRFVYCELPILWIADEAGEIWFAVEEVVDRATHSFVVPRLRNSSVASNLERLGHPALIKGRRGRIGGEIIFDINAEPAAAWYITNGSGRYGLRAGRRPAHLKSAKQAFQKYDIDLDEHFIEPPRG